jgi:HK97 family phage prohead protease
MSTIKRIIRPNAVKFAGNGEVVGARQVLSIVSSEPRDRMGDVILQDGIDYSDFMRGGGTVLWQHDANYPVARTLSVVKGCLTALAQFPPEGTSEKSDECYRLIREGVVNSTSIGFIPVEWEFLEKNRPGSGVLFREVQMLEFSYVSIPANPDALVIAKSLGPRAVPRRHPRSHRCTMRAHWPSGSLKRNIAPRASSGAGGSRGHSRCGQVVLMPLLIEITAAAETALQFDPKLVRAVLRSAGAEIAAVARRARVRSPRTLRSAQSSPDQSMTR